MSDYREAFRENLLEQFRGHENVEVFVQSWAEQLDEVCAFFEQLRDLCSLQSAEGVQLDSIGDIVCLSRQEAYIISESAGKSVPMDDDTYRLFLAWKIALNTNDATHTGVYNALKLFWDKSPLYYREEVDRPATIFYDTPPLPPDANATILFIAPKVKAAGVALYFRATTETVIDEVALRYAGAAFPCLMRTNLPEYA